MVGPVELELLASGRDADVYVLDDDRVLRRYRHGGDVTAEVRFMHHVRAHDFPAPAVFRADGPDLELSRLSGPTLLEALLSNELDAREAAELLADLLWRLHAMPAPTTSNPAVRVLHLDLHPDNVILTPDGPVVIDWRNATEGSPALDLAMTALILAQASLGGDPIMAESAAEVMYAFRERVGRQLLAGLPEAVARRSNDPALTANEVRLLSRAASLVSSPRRPGSH
jgi:tRNA A-37 threonylcarbamoyl transferase component Bud32